MLRGRMPKSSPHARKILDSLPRIAAVADELARTFADASGGGDDVLGAGYLLGAGAAAHWARHLGGAGRLGLRAVDRARIRRSGGAEVDAVESIVDDDRVPGSAIVRGLVAASAGARPRVELGPRAALYAPCVERALGELAASVTTRTEPAEDAGGTTVVAVAPFYWDKRDLDRIVRHLALEVLAPAPGTARVRFLLATGWEQRDFAWQRVLEHVARAPEGSRPPFEMETFDAPRATDALVAAREGITPLGPRRAALYVHPMWRETPGAEAEIARIAKIDGLVSLCLGHRASMPWALGAGGFGETARVDVSSGAPAVATPQAAQRRALFAARPSLFTAARLAVGAQL